MAKPRALILTGYGINCDIETAFAFEKAGSISEIVHINDIIDSPAMLNGYQIFSFPGGFSYGDDVGSGRALANRIKNNLLDEFAAFLDRDTLMLGICNGFQIMVNLGILPGLRTESGKSEVSLEYNKKFRFECRWVDLRIEKSSSVFTEGMNSLYIPVAHGEGNFFADDEMIAAIEERNLAVMRYTLPDGQKADGEFPFNPNGSINDIAAICDSTGRMLGMMPHPERAIFLTQRDDWTFLKEKAKRQGIELNEDGAGLAIFKNAVKYFG